MESEVHTDMGWLVRLTKKGFHVHNILKVGLSCKQLAHDDFGIVAGIRHKPTCWLCYAEPMRSRDPGR